MKPEYLSSNCFHICPSFPDDTFIELPTLYADIATDLACRFDSRLKARRGQMDKSCNHLTSLSNSPGTGKTTALAYFPLSKEYLAYVRGRLGCQDAGLNISDEPPIVSLITFNSDMEGGAKSIGMRIVYGAMKCMGLVHELQWRQFCKQYAELDVESFTALKAVRLLRRVFGEHRLMLIGVDELMKAEGGYDVIAMRELESVLGLDGRTDIVFTALSPGYIEELVRNYSQRYVYCIFVPPLPVETYGLEVHRKRAQATIDKVNAVSEILSPQLQRLLFAAPMLASGHGRSVEHFLADVGQKWDDIEEALRAEHLTAYQLLLKLCEFPCWRHIDYPASSAIRKVILSSERISSRCPLPRQMLESSNCMMYSRDKFSKFKVAIPLASLLRMIDSLSNEVDPMSLAIRSLFNEVIDVSDLWERFCDLTLVASSFERGHIFNPDICRNGVSLLNGLRVRHAEEDRLKESSQWEADTLLIPAKDQQGYDSMICATNDLEEPVYVYNEFQVSPPQKKRTCTAEVVAKKLALMLEDHFVNRCADDSLPKEENEAKMTQHMKNIHFTLYDYDSAARDTPPIFEKDAKLKLCNDVLGVLVKLRSKSKDVRRIDQAIRYVQLCGITNVFVMSQQDMDDWLIPSVIPFASMFNFLNQGQSAASTETQLEM